MYKHLTVNNQCLDDTQGLAGEPSNPTFISRLILNPKLLTLLIITKLTALKFI